MLGSDLSPLEVRCTLSSEKFLNHSNEQVTEDYFEKTTSASSSTKSGTSQGKPALDKICCSLSEMLNCDYENEKAKASKDK